ncbi:aldo/keto reductase [Microbacterium yannicii]|uniref:aldo/keto reductase n=1 Tax=Microbacterium yannicii TaxID=671622 RepID=UPI0002F6A0DD|nr:aldo/keto reductase [Microbacterium yannicii]
MEYRPLGRTGLDVSAVSFGTGSLGGLFGPLEEADALRLVDEAIDSGINLIDTSPYYGSAEYRLGKALTPGKRDCVILASKAGRNGIDSFDFSPERIRSSVEDSLKLLGTDHLDILQLHDIEFVPLGPVLEDGFAELQRLKDAGKTRFIGMTGYPVKTFARVMRETDVDVVLTYAKGTLLDDSLVTELAPVAQECGVGLVNAAAVALGLLTPGGSRLSLDHPAPAEVREAAARMVELAAERGADIAFLANQYAIQRTGAATTVVGVGSSRNLQSALRAAETPIDEALLADMLALRPPVGHRQWSIGLEENN